MGRDASPAELAETPPVRFAELREVSDTTFPSACLPLVRCVRSLGTRYGGGQPLRTQWTLWLRIRDPSVCVDMGWVATQLGWATLSDAVFQHALPHGCCLSLFRKGLRPDADDQHNRIGGYWAPRSDDLECRSAFHALCHGMVEDSLMHDEEQATVCGAVYSADAAGDCVQLWTDGGFSAAEPGRADIPATKLTFDELISATLMRHHLPPAAFEYTEHVRVSPVASKRPWRPRRSQTGGGVHQHVTPSGRVQLVFSSGPRRGTEPEKPSPQPPPATWGAPPPPPGAAAETERAQAAGRRDPVPAAPHQSRAPPRRAEPGEANIRQTAAVAPVVHNVWRRKEEEEEARRAAEEQRLRDDEQRQRQAERDEAEAEDARARLRRLLKQVRKIAGYVDRFKAERREYAEKLDDGSDARYLEWVRPQPSAADEAQRLAERADTGAPLPELRLFVSEAEEARDRLDCEASSARQDVCDLMTLEKERERDERRLEELEERQRRAAERRRRREASAQLSSFNQQIIRRKQMHAAVQLADEELGGGWAHEDDPEPAPADAVPAPAAAAPAPAAAVPAPAPPAAAEHPPAADPPVAVASLPAHPRVPEEGPLADAPARPPSPPTEPAPTWSEGRAAGRAEAEQEPKQRQQRAAAQDGAKSVTQRKAKQQHPQAAATVDTNTGFLLQRQRELQQQQEKQREKERRRAEADRRRMQRQRAAVETDEAAARDAVSAGYLEPMTATFPPLLAESAEAANARAAAREEAAARRWEAEQLVRELRRCDREERLARGRVDSVESDERKVLAQERRLIRERALEEQRQREREEEEERLRKEKEEQRRREEQIRRRKEARLRQQQEDYKLRQAPPLESLAQATVFSAVGEEEDEVAVERRRRPKQQQHKPARKKPEEAAPAGTGADADAAAAPPAEEEAPAAPAEDPAAAPAAAAEHASPPAAAAPAAETVEEGEEAAAPAAEAVGEGEEAESPVHRAAAKHRGVKKRGKGKRKAGAGPAAARVAEVPDAVTREPEDLDVVAEVRRTVASWWGSNRVLSGVAVAAVSILLMAAVAVHVFDVR